MARDDDALRELMGAPVEPEPRSRGGLLALASVLVVIAIVAVVVWIGGDDTDRVDEVAAGSTAAEDAVTSTTPAVVDTTVTTTAGVAYPDPRAVATLVYDDASGRFVMFGGWKQFRAAPILEPWLFDPVTAEWSRFERTFEPSGRELAPAVPVDSLGGILVVGGTPDQTNSCASWNRVLQSPVDLWVLDVDAGSWERVQASGAVSDRWGHAVAYDPAADLVVLFGGVGTEIGRSNRSTLLGDTWVFDPVAVTWEQIDTPVAPSPRSCSGMVYDVVDGSILLWGGQTEETAGDASIWRFDTTTRAWTEQPPVDESGPEPRWLHRMVTLPGSQQVLMVGGMSWQESVIEGGTTTDMAVSDEVWLLDLPTGTWDQLGPAPAATASHALATDGDRVMAFVFGSTLLYDPTTDTWTDVTPYDDLDIDLFLAPAGR